MVRTFVIALLAALTCLAPVTSAAAATCPAPVVKKAKKAKKAKKPARKAKRPKKAKKPRARRAAVVRPCPAPVARPAATSTAIAGPLEPLAAAALPVAKAVPAAPAAAETSVVADVLARRPFAPTSFWNAPLSDQAPLDAHSDDYVAELQRQLQTWAPYVNTTRYSTPVYEVGADQPTVRVTLDQANPRLSAALADVPMPPDAQPSAGTDADIVVWQPSTDTMWDFWRAAKRADGWHTVYGGRMTDVSKNPGYFNDPPQWGASASSLPLLGGLMRLHELRAGRIDHALALAIPERRAKVFSWPAQRTDGTIDSPTAIPEGLRFRIDPTLDLDRLPMAPIVRQMAKAVQRYGMVVRDGADAVTFFAEDPTPTGANPFLGPGGFFGGRYISQLLAAFPWSHLQALETNLSTQR